MKLIIVESPTKARTLTRFLGSGYRIEATLGHIRDLPEKRFGVDLEHDFAPEYVVAAQKKQRVDELKKLAKEADGVILATDPDREGEAIAYHTAVLLKLDVGGPPAGEAGEKLDKEIGSSKLKQNQTSNVQPHHQTSNIQHPTSINRIVFHEITKEAIEEALDHPRGIDMPLVHAQQVRRILDRIVGYKLSPLLWKKIGKKWLSAGRVQSVAVRLIVEREREIQKFKSGQYFRIFGKFETRNSKSEKFDAELVAKDEVKYEVNEKFDLFDGDYTIAKTTIATKEQADGIITDLNPPAGGPFTIAAVDRKEVRRSPAPPFTTSTLQQTAGRTLGFSARRTMQIAQKLYEEGLITYHRTDAVNLSEKFLSAAQQFISQQYGKEFALPKPRYFKNKAKLAQEAHEAIRPTDVGMTHDKFQISNGEFNRDHHRLYSLIWKRAIGSQAAEAVFDATTILVDTANAYQFQTSGSVIKFEGYLRIVGRDSEDIVIPAVAVGDTVSLVTTMPVQKFTDPPPRYSEAKLIKSLEEHGIGRPSTYAPIITTIQDRQYVTRQDEEGNRGKTFLPTELGMTVNDFLVQYFKQVLDLPFTAEIEDGLDAIAGNVKEWVTVLHSFYNSFAKELEEAQNTAENHKIPVEETDELCPKCGQAVVIRLGRFGKFYACSTFPKCDYTKSMVQKIDVKCPKCGTGDVIMRKTRKKKTFYGCSNYPKCDFASWTKPKPV